MVEVLQISTGLNQWEAKSVGSKTIKPKEMESLLMQLQTAILAYLGSISVV